jgi:predicted alpha/beta-fold hydrolase
MSEPSCAFSHVFYDRAPWWGGDLQTLRNQIIRTKQALASASRALEFPTSDGSGDRLTGTLETPLGAITGPLILLIHGLTGCEDSTYVRETARFQLARGRRVLRLNLRGAGSSRKTAVGYYYGACVDDIRAVLVGLDKGIRDQGVFAIGYSLGGNILVNTLGQDWARDYFVGAATVSAPLKPAEAADRLMQPRNAIYHHTLLRQMKFEVLSPFARLSQDERTAIKTANSIYEFDDRFTAPRNGYHDANDYYAKTAGIQFVPELSVPTLLIHARNDPWIPLQPYLDLDGFVAHGSRILITRGGGHVGFHERGCRDTRHDRAINVFLNRRS